MFYTDGQWAEWYLDPWRAHINIPRAEFQTSQRSQYTCTYTGIWNFPGGPRNTNCNWYDGLWHVACVDGGCNWDNGAADQGRAIFGYFKTGTGTPCCTHWTVLRRSAVFYWDKYGPTVNVPAYGSRPWAEQDSLNISGTVDDWGIGLSEEHVTSPGAAAGTTNPFDWTPGCLGTRGNPCDQSHSFSGGSLALNTASAGGFGRTSGGGYREGSIPVDVNVTEKIGRSASKRVATFNIDRSIPRITSYTGSLYDDRRDSDPEGVPLWRSNEHLDVQAHDDYSGVASIQLLVDGQTIDPSHSKTASCGSGGCPRDFGASFDVKPSQIGEGDHLITVRAKDQLADRPGVDNTRHLDDKTWWVWVPPTDDKVEPGDTGEDAPGGYEDSVETVGCPADPEFTDPLYCEPDSTDESFLEISAEPGVDESSLPSPLIAGDNLAAAAVPPTAVDPSSDCSDLGTPISGQRPSGMLGRYGLSDENGYDGERTFDDANAAALGVKRVRLIVPYNLVTGAQGSTGLKPQLCDSYKNVYAWIKYIKDLGMEPLISFNRSPTKRGRDLPPPRSTYRAAVQAFVNQFPYVRLYTAWNEPNYSDQPLRNDALLAGKFWTYLNSICRNATPRCQVGAGDFSDSSNLRSYVKDYWAGQGRHRPPFWAIHLYVTMKTGSTSRFANFLNWGPVNRRGIVWVTEAGSPLYTKSGLVPGGEDTQANRLSALFTSAVYRSNLRVIKRFYYYLWHKNPVAAPPDWGLADASEQGPNMRRTRKIYCVYKAKTAPPCP